MKWDITYLPEAPDDLRRLDGSQRIPKTWALIADRLKLALSISNRAISAPPGHSTGSSPGAGFTNTIRACRLLMGGSLFPN